MTAPFNHATGWAEAAVLSIRRDREQPALDELDAACLVDGVLQPMPAAFYHGRDRQELSYWCLNRGFYCLPTVELIDWLRQRIEGETAIEVGAGQGTIGRALGIPITDSHQQSRPDIAQLYRQIGQVAVQYPPDVERLTAAEASQKYRPSVIIAAWLTWRYNPMRHEQGGNLHGVDETRLLAKPWLDQYIQIEHERVHRKRPIRGRRHVLHRLPFLVSRAFDDGNVIRVWGRR
jgi:hypothetical protein